MGILVEKQVIACIHAYCGAYLPLRAHGEQRRLVFGHAAAVAEFVHGLYLVSLFHGAAVLHAHARLKLIFGCKVECPHLIVDAHDGCNAHAALVGHQVHTLAIGLQRLQTLLCFLQLRLLCLRSRQSGCQVGRCCRGRILCYVALQQGDALVALRDAAGDGCVGVVQERAEGHSPSRRVHHDVVQARLIRGRAVEQPCAAVYRQPVGEFVGRAQRESEVILLAAHIPLHVISRGSQRLQTGCYGAHGALKRADAVLELTFSAAARHAEVELQAPSVLVIGRL